MTPEIGHVMDIMATCIDMAGATYPAKYKETISFLWQAEFASLFSKPVIVKDMIIWASSISMAMHSLQDGWKLVRPGENAKWDSTTDEDRSGTT